MKFTVERSTWARGKTDETNFLFNKYTNKRCCLGFVCKQLGFEDAQLEGVGSPIHLTWPLGGVGRNVLMDNGSTGYESPLTERAITINDDEFIDDEQREENLSKEFKLAGHEMVFID